MRNGRSVEASEAISGNRWPIFGVSAGIGASRRCAMSLSRGAASSFGPKARECVVGIAHASARRSEGSLCTTAHCRPRSSRNQPAVKREWRATRREAVSKRNRLASKSGEKSGGGEKLASWARSSTAAKKRLRETRSALDDESNGGERRQRQQKWQARWRLIVSREIAVAVATSSARWRPNAVKEILSSSAHGGAILIYVICGLSACQ